MRYVKFLIAILAQYVFWEQILNRSVQEMVIKPNVTHKCVVYSVGHM